jgi:hypothetical protein
MKLNAAMLMAALVVSGTVLAQSSGPSAVGPAQAADATTMAQAQDNSKISDSGQPVAQARPAKPGTGGESNTIGASRTKPDRRLEHFP